MHNLLVLHLIKGLDLLNMLALAHDNATGV